VFGGASGHIEDDGPQPGDNAHQHGQPQQSNLGPELRLAQLKKLGKPSKFACGDRRQTASLIHYQQFSLGVPLNAFSVQDCPSLGGIWQVGRLVAKLGAVRQTT